MLAFATIGAAALWLLFLWLLSAAGAAWVAERKGYTERVGLLFGLVLSIIGFVIILLLPSRPGSTWKIEGPFPNPGTRRPLGVGALGPMAEPIEQPDSLGPSLADVVEEPPASEPRASEPPASDGPGGDAAHTD
jgi:hypothetical protein